MDPGLRRDDNLIGLGLSAKPSSSVLNIFLARVAEFEEHAAAPDPEPALAGDPLLPSQLDQLVKYRSRQPCLKPWPRLKPRTHHDIRRRRAVVSGLDPQ